MRLAGKNIPKMTCFVSGELLNLNWVSQSMKAVWRRSLGNQSVFIEKWWGQWMIFCDWNHCTEFPPMLLLTLWFGDVVEWYEARMTWRRTCTVYPQWLSFGIVRWEKNELLTYLDVVSPVPCGKLGDDCPTCYSLWLWTLHHLFSPFPSF